MTGVIKGHGASGDILQKMGVSQPGWCSTWTTEREYWRVVAVVAYYNGEGTQRAFPRVYHRYIQGGSRNSVADPT